MHQPTLQSLTAIIVFYQQIERLRRCLRSLMPSAAMGLTTIVVDNSERLDRSLIECYPTLILISPLENLGFAGACNLASQQVVTPYVLFLNPDTEVETNALTAVVSHLTCNRNSQLVAVRLCSRCGPDPYQAATYPSRFGHVKALSLVAAREKDSVLVEGWVKGAFMAMRTREFSALHGFDERFFLYGEDLELCYRIQRQGGEIHMLTNCSVFHAGNQVWPLSRRVQVSEAVLKFCAIHRTTAQYWLAVLGFLGRLIPRFVTNLLVATDRLGSFKQIIKAILRSYRLKSR